MKVVEAIANINNMNAFIEKGYKLPYDLRRALDKNDVILMEEYEIFDKERNRLLEEANGDKEAVREEINKMLNTDVEVQITKVSISVLKDCDMEYKDELLIKFMLDPEEKIKE